MILLPGAVRPACLMRPQVERGDRSAPVAEVVDAVHHERRGLDRRAHRVVPEHAPVVAVQHPHGAVHPVHDQLLAVDRWRGGHHPADVTPPDGRAVFHQVGADAALVVRDEGDPVVDDGRELEQRAGRAAPDRLERRADADVRMRLGALRGGAVHRPLQLPLVDANADHRAVDEIEALAVAVVPALGDRDQQPAAVRKQNARPPIAVGSPGAAEDVDERAPHGRAQITVEHEHAHERGARLRNRRRPQHGRRGPRSWLLRLLARGAAGRDDEQRQQDERSDPQAAHDRQQARRLYGCLAASIHSTRHFRRTTG